MFDAKEGFPFEKVAWLSSSPCYRKYQACSSLSSQKTDGSLIPSPSIGYATWTLVGALIIPENPKGRWP